MPRPFTLKGGQEIVGLTAAAVGRQVTEYAYIGQWAKCALDLGWEFGIGSMHGKRVDLHETPTDRRVASLAVRSSRIGVFLDDPFAV
jgi:hypothetical protein